MLELEDVRDYCLSKPGVSEDFPFDEDVLVFRVMGKIFALTNVEEQLPSKINIKCDPKRALELRAQYDAVEPGFHMNKKHWNTVTLDATISRELAFSWIDHSYACVAAKLKKSEREALAQMTQGG